mmetsp:Transcript_13910/g.32504  ORF Transcript_13910/g.32504 Transcript_13910/m.32504 type:complete len:232 (+) Transcript_13910:219-914(+)
MPELARRCSISTPLPLRPLSNLALPILLRPMRRWRMRGGTRRRWQMRRVRTRRQRRRLLQMLRRLRRWWRTRRRRYGAFRRGETLETRPPRFLAAPSVAASQLANQRRRQFAPHLLQLTTRLRPLPLLLLLRVSRRGKATSTTRARLRSTRWTGRRGRRRETERGRGRGRGLRPLVHLLRRGTQRRRARRTHQGYKPRRGRILNRALRVRTMSSSRTRLSAQNGSPYSAIK